MNKQPADLILHSSKIRSSEARRPNFGTVSPQGCGGRSLKRKAVSISIAKESFSLEASDRTMFAPGHWLPRRDTALKTFRLRRA